MVPTADVARTIVKEVTSRTDLPPDRILWCEQWVSSYMSYHIGDILAMIKNINETSLPGQDRMNRILELEQKYGVPKTHLM